MEFFISKTIPKLIEVMNIKIFYVYFRKYMFFIVKRAFLNGLKKLAHKNMCIIQQGIKNT